MADSPTLPPFVAIPDHALLRPIGRGSYGEVWLARTVLAEYRAVKIVRQGGGDNDERPVAREFEGLRRFEPVSRSHEGLVHILHAGRFESGFYYVMELADAADAANTAPFPAGGGPDSHAKVQGGKGTGEGLTAAVTSPTEGSLLNPDSYVPRTLRLDLRRRQRLPVPECVNLGLRLADALMYLHGRGLVHRDLKPSNIIFVRGQPKLADIGLVASTDASMSCVGTEGYLPPEGPGKPPADLYALGKILYELATGRDRTEFPELPTLLREAPDRAALEELNEVILRACEPEAGRRYASASEMRSDLALLREGKSLQRRRRAQRFRAVAVKLALATLIVVATLAAAWWLIPDPARSRRLTPRLLAVEQLWPRFDVSPDGERIAFAPPAGILIWERKTSTTRRVEVRGAEGWSTPGISGPVGIPRWSPDGRHLAFMPLRRIGGADDDPTNAFAAFVLDTATGAARQLGPDWSERERLAGWCWERDGQALAACTRERQFFTLRLTGERVSWREVDLPQTHALHVGPLSPDSRWLAVVTDHQPAGRRERDLWLVPHGGGTPVRLTELPGNPSDPAWGPEGDTLYFVSDDGVPQNPTRGLWKLRVNLRTGIPRGPPVEVFSKAGQGLSRPTFVAGGSRLVYVVAEPDTRILVVDAADGSRTNMLTRGRDAVLSPDGRTVYFTGETPEQQGVFAMDRLGTTLPRRLGGIVPLAGNFPRSFLQVSPEGGLMALPGFDGAQAGLFLLSTTDGESRLIERFAEARPTSPAWSPDGQWIAYAVDRELRRVSRDLKTREVLATLLAWDSWNVRWSPDGRHIAALAYGGTNHWHPLDETNHVFVFSLADRRLTQLTPESEDKYKEGLEWHPDSRRLTYFYYGPEKFSAKHKWAFVDRPGHVEEMLDQEGHWDYVGVWAPNGRHFHFTSFPDGNDHANIHVLDVERGDVVHGLRGGSRPEWSRDGKTMVWSVGEAKRYFEEIDWSPL